MNFAWFQGHWTQFRCQLKFNLHKDVQAFLSANELQRSATIGSVDEEEKEIKAASGHGGENSLELKKLPKLLTDYSSQLKICCDLYVQFQSGKGFELATKILKVSCSCSLFWGKEIIKNKKSDT